MDSTIERFNEKVIDFVASTGRKSFQADTEDSFKPAQSVRFSKEIQGSFTEEIEKSQTGLHAEESGLRMETALLSRIGDSKKLEQAFNEWKNSPKKDDYLALTKRFANIDGKDLRGTLLAQAYMALASTEKMDEKAFRQNSKNEVLTREKNTVKFLSARAEKLAQSIQVREKNIQAYQGRIKKLREDYKRKSDEVSKKPLDVSIADTGLRSSSWTGNTAFGADGKQYGPQIPYRHAEHASKRVGDLAFRSNKPADLARSLETVSARLQKANKDLGTLNQKLEAEEAKRAKLQAQLEKAQTRVEENPFDQKAFSEGARVQKELTALNRSKTADGIAAKREEVQTLSYSSPETIEKEIESIRQSIPEYQKLLDQVGDPENIARARQRAEERKTGNLPTDSNDRKAFTSLLWEAEAALDREKSRKVDHLPEEQKQVHTETLARLQMTVAFLKREATILKRNIVTLRVNEARLQERLEVVNRAYDIYEKTRQKSVPKLTAAQTEVAPTARREVSSLPLQAVGDSGTAEAVKPQPKIENALGRYQKALENYGRPYSLYLTVLNDFNLGRKTTPYNDPKRAAEIVRDFQRAQKNLEAEFYKVPAQMRRNIAGTDTPEGRRKRIHEEPLAIQARQKATDIIRKNEQQISEKYIDQLSPEVQVALTLMGRGPITAEDYNKALKEQYEPAQKAFLDYARDRVKKQIPKNNKITISFSSAEKLLEKLYDRLPAGEARKVKSPDDLKKEVAENEFYKKAIAAKKTGNLK